MHDDIILLTGGFFMSRTSVCPWQAGSALNMAPRKLFHNPHRMLGKYISQEMTVMDVGCGMGYFTFPMALMAGTKGKVIAVDLQQEMLAGMQKNADDAGVGNNIIPVNCSGASLCIENRAGIIDFALVFMMLHEVPDQPGIIRELYAALSPKGKLLFAEPIIHVKRAEFDQSLKVMQHTGFHVLDTPSIPICRAAVLAKR